MKDKSIRDAIASLRADLHKLDGHIRFLESVYGKDWTRIKVNGQNCRCVMFPEPPTRYNWPEIIEKYPEAQWASTDKSGRIDYWDRRPIMCDCYVWATGSGPIGSVCKRYTHTQDWADSLEKRPDYL